jgi:hydrogenase expression/formation protein HypD
MKKIRMKYKDEYSSPDVVFGILNQIKKCTTKKWNIMEICGGQTHSILKSGIDELLPEQINLIHGPGCPVCVTPAAVIDKAIRIALTENVILCTYGDMLRVPGNEGDLFSARAKGADVRITYSPMDAVDIAKKNNDKDVVFFGIGFETTAPANAMSIYAAYKEKVQNFSVICSHVLVPPAIYTLLSNPQSNIDGFLAAGHVCTVMGYNEYIPLVEKFNIPIIITGFEPADIAQGIFMCVKQLENDTAELENQYKRSVSKEGNIHAAKILSEVFTISDKSWRGIGVIPMSGYSISEKYSDYNAENKFDVGDIVEKEDPLCISGEILQGYKKPVDCKAFGKKCTPSSPLGAPMVSSEGACSAYYTYKK